jgi:iron complex outermembrane receptor protein
MNKRLSSYTVIIQRLVTTAIAVAVVLPVTSTAQESGAVLEEILVTATRRAEGTNIQTTPVAVTALNSEILSDMFLHDIGEVALKVPNFSAKQITGFNAAGFAMRGASQTDILVYWEPPVGVLVDDFVIPHMQTQLLEPYDLESIEVLRGPQGTLFGKNTTAGVVNVRTKRPHFDSSGLDASVLVGDYGRVELTGAANVRMGDQVAVRIAGMTQESDGYYINGKVGPGPDPLNIIAGDGSKQGGDKAVALRTKLLWRPSQDIDILFQHEYLNDDGDSPITVNETRNPTQAWNFIGFPAASSGDPLDNAGSSLRDSGGLNMSRGHQIDINGYYLNIDWQIGNYTLTSVTGLREQDSVLPSSYGSEAVTLFDATRDDIRETFQQEFRLASNFDGKFNFVAGLFYQTDETSFNVLQYLGLLDFFGIGVPGVLDSDAPRIITNNQELDSFAPYFDFSYDFADTWQLSAGLRFTSEEKQFFARPALPIVLFGASPSDWPFDPNNTSLFPCDATYPCETDTTEWDEPTYRLVLSNQFNDDLYGYAGFSHGFKSGGYSDQAGSAGVFSLAQTRYLPEEADSLELGLKADLMGDRLRLNSAVFYTQYTDMQRATIVTVGALQETVIFNAAEVTAWGVEFEATALLSDSLTLNANIGILDTNYDKFLLDFDLDPSTTPTDLSGNDVTRAPETTAGIDLTYDTPIGDAGGFRAIIGVYYEDESVFYYAVDAPSPGFPGGTPVPQYNTILQDHTLVNASLTYTHSSGRWYASVFGKNLTDERYRNASQYVGGLWTFSTYAEPRVYGFKFGVSL